MELADGTFSGDGNRDVDFSGKAIVVRSETGSAEDCTIDCQGSEVEPHKAFAFDSNEGPGSSLMDVKVVGAHEGALHIIGSSPTIVGCIFEGGEGLNAGGIWITSEANPSVTRCRFVGNGVGNAGGACVLNGNGNGTFTECVFVNNSAYWAGGAVYANHGTATFHDCIFSGNVSDHESIRNLVEILCSPHLVTPLSSSSSFRF